MVDVSRPLPPNVARDLIRAAIKTGTVVFSKHALAELKKDNLFTVDAENVMRGGVVDAPEYEHGEWRYRVRTARIELIVAFNTETEVAVITGWRRS